MGKTSPASVEIIKFFSLFCGIMLLAATVACLVFKAVLMAVCSGIVCAYAINMYVELVKADPPPRDDHAA